MILSYIRCSTKRQSTTPQKNAIKKATGNKRIKWYRDVATGRNSNRPGLQSLLSDAQDGDIIYVWKLDRLGRSLTDGINNLTRLIENNVKVIAISQGLTLGDNSAMGRLLVVLMSALSQWENENRRENILSGLEQWKRDNPGKKLGAKPKQNKRDRILDMLANGKTPAQIAKTLRTNRNAIYQMIKRMRQDGLAA